MDESVRVKLPVIIPWLLPNAADPRDYIYGWFYINLCTYVNVLYIAYCTSYVIYIDKGEKKGGGADRKKRTF